MTAKKEPTQEAIEARKIAIENKQSSAATQATMGKAKLAGLGVENVRADVTTQDVTPADLRVRREAREDAALELLGEVVERPTRH